MRCRTVQNDGDASCQRSVANAPRKGTGAAGGCVATTSRQAAARVPFLGVFLCRRVRAIVICSGTSARRRRPARISSTKGATKGLAHAATNRPMPRLRKAVVLTPTPTGAGPVYSECRERVLCWRRRPLRAGGTGARAPPREDCRQRGQSGDGSERCAVARAAAAGRLPIRLGREAQGLRRSPGARPTSRQRRAGASPA